MEQRLCSEWVVMKDEGTKLQLKCVGDESSMAKDIALMSRHATGYRRYQNEDGVKVLELEFSSASQKDKFYWEVCPLQ